MRFARKQSVNKIPEAHCCHRGQRAFEIFFNGTFLTLPSLTTETCILTEGCTASPALGWQWRIAFLLEAAVDLLFAPLSTERDNIDTITSSGETHQDLIAIRLIGNDVTIAWGNSIHKSQVRTLLTFDRLRRHWNDNLALCRIPNIFGKTIKCRTKSSLPFPAWRIYAFNTLFLSSLSGRLKLDRVSFYAEILFEEKSRYLGWEWNWMAITT